MGMLLSSVGALSTFYPTAKEIDDPEERYMAAIRLIAKVPTLAAFAYRHNMGLPYVYPDNDLNYAENFLSMMFKKTEFKYEPDARLAKALDVLFILHADHEQNCSTNAVRSVGSSHVDPYSAVAAGVAALYGPLHGGANEAVLRMLRRIESVDNIPGFLEGVKNREERLMGFGHRVYKNYDPRARIIKKHVDEVLEATGDNPLLDDRHRAREAGARRRVLHHAQALPERRLLLGPDLRGAAHPDRHVHGHLRDPAHLGLGRAVDGDERRPRAEDRPPAPDLHRRARPRLRRRSPTATDPRRSSGRPRDGRSSCAAGRRPTTAGPLGYKLTIRHGPRVEREAFADLDEAVAALERAAERVLAAGRLEAVRMLRDFEPSERVAARLELSSGGALRGRAAGVDVMGDGSVVPFAGGVMRRRLEAREGESEYDAVRRELSR